MFHNVSLDCYVREEEAAQKIQTQKHTYVNKKQITHILQTTIN